MSELSRRQAGQLLASELIRDAQSVCDVSNNAGLTADVISNLELEFMTCSPSGGLAARNGRGDKEYWLDHGRVTGELMRIMADKWGGAKELYFRVGYVHDLDYLRFPHDVPESKSAPDGAHPIPLARAMRAMGVHASVVLAVLEHAPYLRLCDTPSSRLSASLSAAEDLATLAALDPPFEDLAVLSNEARDLLQTVRVYKKFSRTDPVRVEINPARFINAPLSMVVDGGPFQLSL